jgi:hypothetical protein
VLAFNIFILFTKGLFYPGKNPKKTSHYYGVSKTALKPYYEV